MAIEVNKLSASHLKQIIDSQASAKLLLLDFRSFLAYNNDKIKGAVNVFCPSILKRRFAATGNLRLESVLTPEVRKKLRNGDYTKLVLYEQDDNIRDTSDLAVVLQGLNNERYGFKTVYILKGGFQKFRTKYPLCCIGQKGSRDIPSCAISMLSPLKSIRLPKSVDFKHAPTQLLPHLYIGNERNSLDTDLLKQIGVTAILNVSTQSSNSMTADFEYKCIPVRDNESENISSWFSEAFHFIESIRRHDGITLVHCRAGISRSATICIAYLMAHQSFTLDQAFEFVRSRRDIISPNLNFMQQLFEFERMLLVQRMRDVVCPSVHDRKSPRTPLSCSTKTERSPVVVSNQFSFNICTHN